jgi:gas vesicle protein
MGTKSDISSFFSGFFVGALIGGATALLLAPQSGEETRTQLRERGIELRDRAEATYADVLQRVEATTEELRQRTDEISAKVDEAIAQGRQEIARMRKQAGQEASEGAEEASGEG